jgi:hypothetical protein
VETSDIITSIASVDPISEGEGQIHAMSFLRLVVVEPSLWTGRKQFITHGKKQTSDRRPMASRPGSNRAISPHV